MRFIVAQVSTPQSQPPQVSIPPIDLTTGALIASVSALIYQFAKTQLTSFTKRSEIEVDRDVANHSATQKMVEALLEQQKSSYASMLQNERDDRHKMVMIIEENTKVIQRCLSLLDENSKVIEKCLALLQSKNQ